MKKLLCILFVICGSITVSQAQKFGYVDTEYILKHMPEYAAAQKQLDVTATQWQKEIEGRRQEIETLYKAYQAEEVLLTPAQRQKREQGIMEKEKALDDFQRLKFGFEGEMFQKRKDLIKPIQDKIYKAVEQVAKDGLYGIIFDKTSELIMLYSDPRFDKSDDVLKELGLKPGEFVQ